MRRWRCAWCEVIADAVVSTTSTEINAPLMLIIPHSRSVAGRG
ncbi:hypothetical protein BN1184_AT_00060 [Pantoea ananatis]|nr:hypothetical protein BN1184_AT_00060 [Pantoea ananatis]